MITPGVICLNAGVLIYIKGVCGYTVALSIYIKGVCPYAVSPSINIGGWARQMGNAKPGRGWGPKRDFGFCSFYLT
jgi:hypothetical protein